MFDVIQSWAIGLAVVLDSALLAVLLERRNRRYARLPIVFLLVGAWLLHVGSFVLIVVEPLSGFGAAWVETACLLAMAAGILIKPSAILHGAIRFAKTGFDLRTRSNPRFAILYLPLATLAPLAVALEPTGGGAPIDPLLPWAMPFALWASACNLIAAAVFVGRRPYGVVPGMRPFLDLVAALLVVQSFAMLFVFGYAHDAWPDWRGPLLFACGLPPVAMAIVFGYFLVRFNFFRLAMERAIVYGAVLAAIALFHQFAFQEAAAVLPRSYRLGLIGLETALIVALIALDRPLRQRCAEAVRYLMGERVSTRRERLRQLSTRLSATVNRSAVDILEWFATELTAALDVEFASVWIFQNDSASRFGGDSRISAVAATLIAGHMRSAGLPTMLATESSGTAFAEAVQNAGVSLAAYKTHRNYEGLLIVGKHVRSRDLSDEEVNAVVLLVAQLGVTLENSLLIAERLAAERRAGHLETLSALGLLSSAIAHEVKNPLSAMKTIAAVLAENIGPDSPHAEDVAMIRGEIDRLAKTTNQLLQIARPKLLGNTTVCVEEVLSSTVQLLRRLAQQKEIAIDLHCSANLPPIRGDETTLREIVFNLMSNSLDAAGDGGRVSLTGVRLNGHIVIEVRDNGPGIDAGVKERLFEPFVTTKPAGTGLGLYVVERRVRELGGQIACESQPGATSFTVKIPVYDAPHLDRR
jgi:signal transduction histidine kinase